LAVKHTFLLRLDPEIMASLKQWSADELRSMNAHIEFLLRRSLIEAGRAPKSGSSDRTRGRTNERKK
jgi:hypothetical protein